MQWENWMFRKHKFVLSTNFVTITVYTINSIERIIELLSNEPKISLNLSFIIPNFDRNIFRHNTQGKLEAQLRVA